MDKKLRDGLLKLLDSLPAGATGGSLNWADDDTSYAVTASSSSSVSGTWQLWASSYLIQKPMEYAAMPTVAVQEVG